MTYNIIGLMSGSSLDGLDICYTCITIISGKKWEYEIVHADCIPYSEDLKVQLKNAAVLSVPEFLRLNIAFGRFCAGEINQFIDKYDLHHKAFFIASHGHTAWHEPGANVSCQIGDGATIAALTGYPTISDLRDMDVALGGQGAPIVPIADQLLFSDYDFCLNLGGIANITVNSADEPLAFDICPANQLLDHFARKKGVAFDRDGILARAGQCNPNSLAAINQQEYYLKTAPKSLSNTFSAEEIIPHLEKEENVENALATAVAHIAEQIATAIGPYCHDKGSFNMLVSGGGALNKQLIAAINVALIEKNLPVTCILPDEKVIHFKEALAMAVIGALRWREENNVLASVTGASRNSIGGAFWMGSH
ncbi:MAG TPA: anhydro-N-acetylmuramic acid kinase [Edaphocola sp.]|nr:anhydro-N-acetylmuramic acid kinase [Edaphocola sp.]